MHGVGEDGEGAFLVFRADSGYGVTGRLYTDV